jgi:hypothetical protein
MIGMLLVGYVFAVRSERRLCSEGQVNLAYGWFCKLSVEDKIPDNSVFSQARHERFRESDALRLVLRAWWRRASRLGLDGEAFSVDASLIKADVDKKKPAPGDQPIAWPKAEPASYAVREHLMALDTAHSKEENGDGDDGGSSGGRRRKPPKEVSLTDPQATWVAMPGMDPFFAYDANYLIDNKAGITIDAEGTVANRVVEISVTRIMIERVARRFGLQPQRPAGDTVLWRRQPAEVAGRSSDHTAFRCGTSRRAPTAHSLAPICLRPRAECLCLPRWRAADRHRQHRQGHIVCYRANK